MENLSSSAAKALFSGSTYALASATLNAAQQRLIADLAWCISAPSCAWTPETEEGLVALLLVFGGWLDLRLTRRNRVRRLVETWSAPDCPDPRWRTDWETTQSVRRSGMTPEQAKTLVQAAVKEAVASLKRLEWSCTTSDRWSRLRYCAGVVGMTP